MNLLAQIRHGAFVTDRRVTAYSLLLLMAFAVALAFIWLTSDGMRDYNGKPLGTDFINLYSAGRMLHEGSINQIYDAQSQHQVETNISGDSAHFYGWHYPPPFLLVAWVVATVPYGFALALYALLTLGLCLHSLSRVDIGRAVPFVCLLAFPAFFINLIHGQNGFLTVWLLTIGFLNLKDRPFWAGAAWGSLIYKPQLFFLLPFALLAGRNLKALSGVLASAFALSLVTLALWGADPWVAFFHNMDEVKQVLIQQEGLSWGKSQSLFAALRLWGVEADAAMLVQGGVYLALMAGIWWVWRKSKLSLPIQTAFLCCALPLATPYVLDYDLCLLALPWVLLNVEGKTHTWPPYMRTLTFLMWVLPLFARPLGMGGFPVTPFYLLTMLALLAWKGDGFATAMRVVNRS